MSGEANVSFIYAYLFIGWFMVICTPDPACVTLASCTVQGFKYVHVVLSLYSCILLSYYYSTFTLDYSLSSCLQKVFFSISILP